MLSLILLQQIAQLFIIIFLGWAIVKAGILKSEDSRVLSMLLLYVIIPCVILNAFQIERTTDTVRMMELSLLSALMMNVLSLVLTVGKAVLPKYSGNSLCHVLELHQHGGSACHRNFW